MNQPHMRGALAGAAMLLGAGALVALTAAPAAAQAWPTRPILAVIPFSAGNANDVVGRVVLDQLSQQLGEPIVIENRAGAGGTTGVAFVAKAAPDGYTILVHSSTFSAAQAIYKTLPYDTLHDFASIVPLGLQPTVLVASPSKGWKTVADLITAAKAKPARSLSHPPASAAPRIWRPSGCASAPDSRPCTSPTAAPTRRSPT